VRAGLGLDDFFHIMGEEARYAGTLGGAEWSRWLADRTVHLNGARTDDAGPQACVRPRLHGRWPTTRGAFDDLPPALQRTMEDYGLTEGLGQAARRRAIPPQPDSAGICGHSTWRRRTASWPSATSR
jgi:hypothetical protein